MSAPIPVGSRVVLVEDNAQGVEYGRKGDRGVVVDSPDSYGDYDIRFDHSDETWWVNASAVALESPEPESARAQLVEMAQKADWGQVACNGGPPCFYVDGNRFCLRAERWAGHGSSAHPFISLAQLLATSPAPAPLDTDALAMALQLADLCEWVPYPGPFRIQSKVARWLRAEVQRELWRAR